MNDTPGQAGFHSQTFTSDEPAQDLGLPAGSLREGWAGQLRDIEQATSWDTLAGAFQYSAGWLAALLQANVIDAPTCHALREARNALYNAATERLAGGAQ